MTAPSDPTVADTPPTGLSRRSVVRVGAAAAWSVPVVALATSAPALAASGKVLSIPTFTIGAFVDDERWPVSVVVRNESDTHSASDLQVVFVVPEGTRRLSQPPSILTSGLSPNWSASGPTTQGSNPQTWTYLLTYSPGLAASADTTLNFNFTRTAGNKNSSQIVRSVTATALAPTSGFPSAGNAADIS